jgi:predicted metal-dependent HD superfamily phosphohydrolase
MPQTLPPPMYEAWCERFAKVLVQDPTNSPVSPIDSSGDGFGGVHATCFAELIGRYGEAHRRYHGIDHVLAVVNRLPEIGRHQWPTLTDEVLHRRLSDVMLGAWYHDVIYDPLRSDNEDASADFAIVHLRRCGLSSSRISHVVDLILMTKGHRARTDEEAVLADADLWTLGGTPEEYARYGGLIRQEYAHVSDTDWARGRSAAMQIYLDRPFIFSTAYGQSTREAQAQVNILADATGHR